MSRLLILENVKMLRGFLHNKCPRIKIILIGEQEEEIEVIIDTGFNGYLALSEDIATRLKLHATGAVGSSTIADGSTSPYVSYLGKISYNDMRIDTEIEVQPKAKRLLGMSLLEELDLSLFVDIKNKSVELDRSGKVR